MKRLQYLLRLISIALVSLLLPLWVTASVYAQPVGPDPLKQAYFGDTHVHTSWSPDAFTQGTRTTPRDAYAYAKGEAIPHAAGYMIQLRQPLDFYMVTDHSEYMGVLPKTLDPQEPLYKSEIAKLLRDPSPEAREDAFSQIVSSITAGVPIAELSKPEISRSIWQEIVQIADENYEPGKFTTFPAYEWTSNGPLGTQNLHRNIIFRSSEAVPELPFSAIDSVKPEELWNFMDGLREEGITLLAIPHNPNLSDGLMFPMVDSYGQPLSAEYAEQRMRNEPVVEATQIKGTSETHPLLSDTDEFANFEISDLRIDMTNPGSRAQSKGSYIRDAYKTGMVFEESLGINPYKFGMVAATDTHNAGAPIEEDNYFGKLGFEDGTPEARLQNEGLLADFVKTWGASGLAAVWAEENTREAIYDAFTRKETFATTGPRIRVRLFGGWDFTDADLSDSDWVQTGYDKGVPMGADLPSPSDTATAPSFLVAAVKDPNTANLDRIQIVKGWSKYGQSYEQVYDVALSDGRQVDPETSEAPAVGNTVNISTATYSNTIGDTQLMAAWTDPDFDPEARAFYYARVLEIPTPRWSTYDAITLGITPPEPTTLQERAFTSAIWYTPSGEQLESVQDEALTVANIEMEGGRQLSTEEIKQLLVGHRVQITNLPTEEVFDAYYSLNGTRTLAKKLSQATFGGFHAGGLGIGTATAPYTIDNDLLSSSLEDGSAFSSRLFELDGDYYAARGDEAGYVNYELDVIR